jgi:hypothetical protein
MVAIEKRRKAAQLLLDFYNGGITNDQMEDAWPRDARDPILCRVFWTSWGLYSDLREEYIDPKLRRRYPTAKAIHRCLVFLKSGLEYEWVGFGLSKGPVPRLLELLDEHRRKINRAGDQSVWPFYRKEDYRRAWQQQN